MSNVVLGIERLLAERRPLIAGRRLGLVAHPASVDRRLEHTLDRLLAAGADVRVLFGPEHGFAGEAQDMVAVGGARRGPRGLPLVSLYGATEETLSPGPEHLAGLDALVIDLADVGSRYYTFVWTAVLCVRACHRAGVDAIVLDRPNPLGGEEIEGAPQREGFLSFVGLLPVPNRHGMTIGEIARFAARLDGTADALTVVTMEGWRRGMPFEETGAPWVMPSPNMPTPDTATAYPGQVLLEGTNLSEGRVTTRPFEWFGAPWIDGYVLARELNALGLPGVGLREAWFTPTFSKFAGGRCGGCQLHVVDRETYRPVATTLALLEVVRRLYGAKLELHADYFDKVMGTSAAREGLLAGKSWQEIAAGWQAGLAEFARKREPWLLYSQ